MSYGRPWSERFAIATSPDVYVTYHVPTGRRAVVKMFSAVNDGTAAGNAYCIGPGFLAAKLVLQAGQTAMFTSMHLVAYAGETISLLTTYGGIHCSCFGYLLDADAAAVDGEVTELPIDRVKPLPAGVELGAAG